MQFETAITFPFHVHNDLLIVSSFALRFTWSEISLQIQLLQAFKIN